MSEDPDSLRQEGPRILKRWLAQYKKPTLVTAEKMTDLQVKKMHDKLDLYNPWSDDHNYVRMTKPYLKKKEEEHLDSTEEMDTGDFDIYSAVEIEDFEAQEVGKGESSGASWCVRKFEDALTELLSKKQQGTTPGRNDGRKFVILKNRPFTQEERDYYKFDGSQYQDDGDPWGFKAEMEQLKRLVQSREAIQHQQIAPV